MECLDQLDQLDRHFWMTRSVARAMGLNLGDAIRRGELGPDRYAEMVAICRQCPHLDRCQDWLARSSAGAVRAAAFCAHADTLNTLKRNRETKGPST